MLSGTFEEYIVGRLMEKLQMASHAIGDIEALLEASGIGGDDENGASFDEKIRELVVAALAGKDVEKATRLAETSIDNAKIELEREEESINAMLGGMDGAEYVGPRAPTLPTVERSMTPREFTLSALQTLGAKVAAQPSGIYLAQENGGREYIRFEEGAAPGTRSTLYGPGTPAFSRLVSRVIATGICDVEDIDRASAKEAEEIARRWVAGFGGTAKSAEVEDAERCFEGTALVRVRSTVAHDSYERLVEVPCSPTDHHVSGGRGALGPIARVLENPSSAGINLENLAEAAELDPAIAEFSRFYLERREQEMRAAGGDERKRKKLEDEFTPLLSMTLVGLQGRLHRRLKVKTRYRIDSDAEYGSTLAVTPSRGEIADAPELALCTQSGRTVPRECLKLCEVTGAEVLQHYLTKSDISLRRALPEFTLVCSLSGKRMLRDEGETSAVTGRLVARTLLKTSALSGKRAEPDHFGRCEFSGAEALSSELAVSEISSKRYRADEGMRSAVSGKAGHKQEFLLCHETRQPLGLSEAEQYEVTGHKVRPGVLEECAITHSGRDAGQPHECKGGVGSRPEVADRGCRCVRGQRPAHRRVAASSWRD